jgi:hypothetical protein
MPLPAYQYMAKLSVGFPVYKRPNIFMYVAMWEHHTLTARFLDGEEITIPTPLPLLISCKPSFPTAGLKVSSLPTLAFKSPNKIFIHTLGNLLNTSVHYRGCPSHHQLYPLLGHQHSEQ